MKPRYEILRAADRDILATVVTEALNEGLTLQGGVAISIEIDGNSVERIYHQALTRPLQPGESDKNEDDDLPF